MNRKIIVAVMIVVLVLAFTACGGNFDPTETGVFVKKDKTLEGAYIEPFEKANYDLGALTAMGQEEVQAYNRQKANLDFYSSEQTKEKLRISLNEIKKEDNHVIVRMSYASAEDYVAFNKDDITMAGGDTLYTETLGNSSVSLEGTFVTVSGEPVTIDEIMKNGEYHLVYLNYQSNITVDGRIMYVSDNVNCNTKNNVSTGAAQASFIIFK